MRSDPKKTPHQTVQHSSSCRTPCEHYSRKAVRTESGQVLDFAPHESFLALQRTLLRWTI